MANFLPRSLVNERLRIKAVATSYRILGSPRRYGARINSDHVLELLNSSRRGPQPVLTYLPSDLHTAKELAEILDGSYISAHDLTNWSNRVKNTVPHFRLTSHHRLFLPKEVLRWLDDTSIGSRRETA